jgi:hypothetical protein
MQGVMGRLWIKHRVKYPVLCGKRADLDNNPHPKWPEAFYSQIMSSESEQDYDF